MSLSKHTADPSAGGVACPRSSCGGAVDVRWGPGGCVHACGWAHGCAHGFGGGRGGGLVVVAVQDDDWGFWDSFLPRDIESCLISLFMHI